MYGRSHFAKTGAAQQWYVRIRAVQTGHYQQSLQYRRQHLCLGIPVVVLSAVVGTAVFSTLNETETPIFVKIILGSTSILTAAIASLQTFLNYDSLSEKHLGAATKLSAIKKEIEEKTIVLTEDQEFTNFIEQVRLKWTSVTDEYPQISDKIWNRYCNQQIKGKFLDFEAVKATHNLKDQP
ncbi:MAG: SLATT domain-containing protein [Limnothrix sp. RL_2_0]|nr:SLATT domain-containing protein [Limnothrix sp. RL_2_0]